MRHNLNEDFLDSVSSSDVISSEDERREMRYCIKIGDFPLIEKEMRQGAPQIEKVYSVVKKYVDNNFEFAAVHETTAVFEYGEPDNGDFVQHRAQHDCSIKDLREFMKGVPDEPSFDQHEIVFCDIIVSFAVTKPVTFRKFSRMFGHFLDTTLHGLPADAEVLLLERDKAPYTLYKKNLKGAPVVSFEIMRNL
jgi:hypothetical protein